MQVADTRELPKRSRYYKSVIDLQMIDKGQHYKELKPSYIIFICPFDLFGKGRHLYTFENICKEDTSVSLKDEAVRIFLNADSSQDDVSKELKAFLDYVAGKESEDDFVKRLEEAVREARKNREWRHEYMTLLMRDQENIEKGIEKGMRKGMEKGKSVGEEMMLMLIQKLVDDSRFDDIAKIKDNKDYRRKLYTEYNISI